MNGESYSGNTTQTFKHPIISTQTMKVRYLPYWLGINAAVRDAKVTGGLILVGLGVLLFVLGIKGEISFGGRNKLPGDK